MDQSLEGLPGRYWHVLEDGRIQCDVCPRYCKLHKSQRGLCFVRARQDDCVVLTTYGRSSGFCIDPIEKKPLNHFLPGTPVLSFGTAGCNLTCKFCQNWERVITRSRSAISSSIVYRKSGKAVRKRETACLIPSGPRTICGSMVDELGGIELGPSPVCPHPKSPAELGVRRVCSPPVSLDLSCGISSKCARH
jgi:hypothetical protein